MEVVVQPLGFVYKVKIGDVVVYCKQLSYRVRSMIGARFHAQKSGTEMHDMVGLLFEVLRHSIVKVEGFVNPDGSPFELEFENDVLTENCLDSLMYVERVGDTLQLCASNFLNMKVPDKFLGVDGRIIEGVTIEKTQLDKKKQ